MTAAVAPAALPPLKDLRPADGSSSAIRSAFARLVDARAANAAEMERMEAARPGLLLTATAAEIDKTDEALRRRRIFAEQLDLLEPELIKMASEAQKNEENRAYIEKFAEVKARAEAWNARILAEYPALVHAFTPLFAEEMEVYRAINDLTNMPGARRVGGETATSLWHALRMMCQRSPYQSLHDYKTFGQCISFPMLDSGLSVAGCPPYPTPRQPNPECQEAAEPKRYAENDVGPGGAFIVMANPPPDSIIRTSAHS
jgi:hypothetical protein